LATGANGVSGVLLEPRKPFIDYFIKRKEFEKSRFLPDVTGWEQRECFAIL